MAAKDVALDVANALATLLSAQLSPATYAVGTQIKKGSPRSPTELGNGAVVVWVEVTGGRSPTVLTNVVVSGKLRHASVMCTAIGAPDDQDGARALAQQFFEALDTKHQDIPAVSGPAYESCFAFASEPNKAGVDEANRYHYTMNFELSWSDVN